MVRKPGTALITTPFTQSFDSVVHEALSRFHVPGIALAVVDGEKTWTKGYGLAQIDENKPATPSTLYYVGSTTKAQLCLAWAIYIDSDSNKDHRGEKRITFSTPIVDIIRDDFVLQDQTITNLITLEDALSHRTGQHSHDNSYGRPGVQTQQAVVRNLRNLPSTTHLRTQFEYCNTMYVAASHALEVVTGQPLSKLLRGLLWNGLSMDDTYAGYDEAKEAVNKKGSILALGYTWSKIYSDHDHNNGEQLPNGNMDFPEVGGAGYVISTASDYAKWMRCWLSADGPLNDNLRHELWRPRTIDLSSTTVHLGSDKLYCLGWWKVRAYDKDVFFHSGGVSGAGALIVLIPEVKWGVTFFANSTACGSTLFGVAWYLLEQKFNISEDERLRNFRHRNDEIIAGYAARHRDYLHARQRLFPGAGAAPSVPLSLPIKAYAGTYWHAGYGYFHLHLANDVQGDFLLGSLDDRTWPKTILLRHVNAEHRFSSIWFSNMPSRDAAKAETSIGANGEVLALALSLGDGEDILTFAKVESKDLNTA